MTLRIGIDARPIDNSSKPGMGVYTNELITHLTRCDRENHYYLYFNSLRRRVHLMPGPELPNVTKTVIPIPSVNRGAVSALWQRAFLPHYIRKQQIDIYHSTFSLHLPKSNKIKKVLTVHDLAYIHFNHEFLSISRNKLYQHYMRAIEMADACIAISHHTKHDILNHYNIDPKKIHVIHLGVSNRFHPIRDDTLIDKLRSKYHLPQRFILTIGASKRKNTHGLLNAFAVLKQESKIDHKLLIVAGLGKWNEDIPHLIRNLGLSKDVEFRGFFPDEDLPLLYNAAELFVFPSLFEGFGIPPLEAMRSGIPVVVSNSTSLPEVVGPGGVMVNPNDCVSLAKAMERVLTDSDLYETLRRKGLRQATEFSWLKTARQTLDVYRKACGQHV